MMKAIVLETPGGPEQLRLGEAPLPNPAPDELLVRVHATALNRADLLQREGKYPPPPGASPLLGLEMAGVVEAVGGDCGGWHPGDRVCALLPGGGYAEYVTVPARMAIPVPDTLSLSDAAAIPEVFLTAYQGLFWIGELRGGETVLIHAGASGVGTAAIQLARMAGASVIVTAGSADKLAFCRKLGAETGINYKEDDFADAVMAATDDKGVNLVLDFIGAAYWAQNIRCLQADGRLVLLATMGGGKVDAVSLRDILVKRLRIQGSTLRSRDLRYKSRLTMDLVKHVMPKIAEGNIHPVVDSVYPWEDVAEAHRHMEANRNIGKIILRVVPEGEEGPESDTGADT